MGALILAFTFTGLCFSSFQPSPAIRSVFPAPLLTATTNAGTVYGNNFTPNTLAFASGAPLATTYVSATQLSVQIPVAASASGSLALTVQNPAPGGGSSAVFQAPIGSLSICLTPVGANGVANVSSVRLGQSVQFYYSVQGSGNPAGSWQVAWTLSGSGTLSSSGLYRAPDSLASTLSPVITATLISNSQISTAYGLTIVNPMPVINGSSPTRVEPGLTNVLTLLGSGFVPGTLVLVDGQVAKTNYVSPTSITVQAEVPGNATSIAVSAQNPAPGASASKLYTIQVDSGDSTVAVTFSDTPTVLIPKTFLGLSHEWPDAAAMGTAAGGVNQIYRQLVENLMVGNTYPFLIRIGGGSTDQTTMPMDTTSFSELSEALGVQFTLGVNLGSADSSLAISQASTYVTEMPSGSLNALEIGNEPDAYVGKGFRTAPYAIADYLADFSLWQHGISPFLPPGVTLMSPSWSYTGYLTSNFAAFETNDAQYSSLISQHYYAGVNNGQIFPADFLLQPAISTSAAASVKAQVSLAHSKGQLFRIGEMNSITGGGYVGVSNTFSSALWAIDTMFEFTNVGVDGVNWHGMSGCAYCPFSFRTQWSPSGNIFILQQVNPIYYGMLLFQQATANGSSVLPTTVHAGGANVKVWATKDANKTVRIVILNKDESFAGNVTLTLPGYGSATVRRLEAPSYASTSGITLAGQTFDASLDGLLVGNEVSETIQSAGGTYTIAVSPTSAVLLTLPSGVN